MALRHLDRTLRIDVTLKSSQKRVTIYDLWAILSNCKTHTSYHKVEHINYCIERRTEIIKDNSELSDADTDRLGIRLVGDESSKGSLAVHRRRGCI